MRRTQDRPIVWLGQSVDTSSLCSSYPELQDGNFLTSLGCAIRRPSLLKTHFNGSLRRKLGVTGPLMLDSGGFALLNNPHARWTASTVATLIEAVSADVYVSLDFPPVASDTTDDRRSKIARSFQNYRSLESQPIHFTVTRRKRRTMQISVLPDTSVEVVAPLTTSESDILKRMRKRAGWVCRQMRYFQQYLPRTPERQFVAGETHLYLGRRYRLKVVRSLLPAVKLKHGFIEVHTHLPSPRGAARQQVEEWQKAKAHDTTGLPNAFVNSRVPTLIGQIDLLSNN
jgi:hypothetical protein